MQMIRNFFQPTEFTGKHMLFAMVAFFGVIITVNLVMARFAVTTWSGLVVPNTYVASQQFNGKAAEARAIAALGYEIELAPETDGLTIVLTDSQGNAARADQMVAVVRRPVGTHQDREMVLVQTSPGVYHADGELAEGQWIATVTATRNGETLYKRAQRFQVRADGSLRP
ncbi:FixH family protein [Hoeflea sp. YIM 152468]|uniref:FixH family protein n=1 Tax=Hoeflea sp. YIM 152468 TaxID=3031759 RepID=UPI0023DC7DC5|nr:FixH family protein [Hoeflea sp. YIM 152468]MDF1607789.1 FixH family protein [Hoeflea sp. YIM 152468]